MCIKKLNKGGHILIDNVLWSGKVLEKIKDNDKETLEINTLNKKIKEDKRVENILLPIRDGLMICKLKIKWIKYTFWFTLIVLWNFGYPHATPLLDVLIAVLLSIITYFLKRNK